MMNLVFQPIIIALQKIENINTINLKNYKS